jgi:translation initiation factor 2B subunit (eIF-2B alpha/beta/delta family)
VCKIGGYALALAAHRAKRPTLVVADSHKVLPRSLAPVTSEEHDPNELGPAEPGVRTLNVYFESVPGRLLSRIITERGLWTRGELRRHALRAPRRLARR